ncbi:MAG: galactose-1-epimerase, partial [Bacteroidales bacterium]|nr:galactose-1-epimerase [Bacteroidales bacterium]
MENTDTKGDLICGLSKADFQTVIDGKHTDLYVLKNPSGAEIAVTNYGGAVAAIM